MSLNLIQHFGVVSVQGAPLFGHRCFGVPPGGAFDQESIAIANVLAGNVETQASWELSMAQATFRADRAGVVGVAGAVAKIRHRSDIFETNSAFAVLAGEEFTVEAPSSGSRVYVSFGSQVRTPKWRIRMEEGPGSVSDRNVIRVVEGPQIAMLDRRRLNDSFTVSRTVNRVGLRLEPSIGSHAIELPSEPACVGAIQISNDGTPIVFGPDGPTIGGYPKIAVVTSSDVGRVGQLSPGDSVQFELCTIEEARVLFHEAKERLMRQLRLLKLTTSP